MTSMLACVGIMRCETAAFCTCIPWLDVYVYLYLEMYAAIIPPWGCIR